MSFVPLFQILNLVASSHEKVKKESKSFEFFGYSISPQNLNLVLLKSQNKYEFLTGHLDNKREMFLKLWFNNDVELL